MNVQTLSKLIPILRANGVANFKMAGLELSFYVGHKDVVPAEVLAPPPSDSVANIAEAVRKQEESLPPSLRADSLMDEDKILNWSSPDQQADQMAIPLTGES